MSAERRDVVEGMRAAWARERPELDSDLLVIEARVLRLARWLQTNAERTIASELSLGELNVLAALRRAGPPYGRTPTQLTHALLLSSGAMTNRIDNLEERGLVRREPSTTDRRKVVIRLLPEGSALVDEAMDALVASLEGPLGVLDTDEREQLTDLLAKVLAHVEAS